MSLEKIQTEEKRKKIDSIFQHKIPDAIFVLSGDIVKAPEGRTTKSGYKSPSYADLDVRGLLSGGRARVVATAEASKYFKNATLVPDSRDRDLSRGRPTHASVYADELENLGVPRKRIELEEESINTITEIVEAIKMAVRPEHAWRTIAMVSNEYQLDRIQEMYNQIQELADPRDGEFADAFRKFTAAGGELVLASAEQILAVRSSHYARFLRQVKGTLAYHVRQLSEQRGIFDLLTKKYRKEP